MNKLLLALGLSVVVHGTVWAQAKTIEVGTPLKILKDVSSVTVETDDGPVTITRKMTPCAKNGGVLQAVVPQAGVHPVGEIEILEALQDKDNSLVVDMRETSDRVKGTIPGSLGIPSTEVASRLNELGCERQGEAWACAQAKKVYAFCNGPVCPQSPIAIAAMVREGFPAGKIYYYRGGMLDWDALGFTVIKDAF